MLGKNSGWPSKLVGVSRVTGPCFRIAPDWLQSHMTYLNKKGNSLDSFTRNNSAVNNSAIMFQIIRSILGLE